ncbi:zinc finger protein [Parasponia andersonii]|uniref:Zinc finger protein n=1 Tax=Parasponia andersonii TaxID=3476 RepID=A0A2P5CA37_PARAD|nr:zinc finger protein [Parasponia andersonii]
MSRPGDWNCRSCNHLNFQRRESCQRCGEGRPAGGERTSGDYGGFGGRAGGGSFGFTTGPDVRPGDWYCAIGNCGAHNFASRSSCYKCGAFKDDSSTGGGGGGYEAELPRMRGYGFGGGGSSRSGWKSGDWICTRSDCNEHNFASRMECFRCNAPRDSCSGKSPYSS